MALHRVAAVVLPLCWGPLYASDPPTELLDPIIVTAARTARTADETLASVTVITREEIDRRRATSVQEVLRGVPGLGVANNGGLGKATFVFLRGTESDHVLVLVDGIRIRLGHLGHDRVRGYPDRSNRTHRGGARPAIQPLWVGGHRWRDPDLHPQGRRPAQAIVQRGRREPCDLQALRGLNGGRRSRLVQSQCEPARHGGIQRVQQHDRATRRMLHLRAR